MEKDNLDQDKDLCHLEHTKIIGDQQELNTQEADQMLGPSLAMEEGSVQLKNTKVIIREENNLGGEIN